VGRALEYNLTTLRISRAYVSLLSHPEGSETPISLTWIGDYQIRMHPAPLTGDGEQALFIIELFDHDAQRSIGSRACTSVADGADVFDEFLHLVEPATSGPH
jgi:hypothetical protein